MSEVTKATIFLLSLVGYWYDKVTSRVAGHNSPKDVRVPNRPPWCHSSESYFKAPDKVVR
jgi:hypothetical protein